jgi:hypothetical protein
MRDLRKITRAKIVVDVSTRGEWPFASPAGWDRFDLDRVQVNNVFYLPWCR